MLTWLKNAGRIGTRNRLQALYECGFCGSQKIIRVESVTAGNTISCGCQKIREIHGLRKHPLYSIWDAMKQRCLNTSHPKYHRYGGRGIRIFPAWLDNVESFIAYVTALPNALQPELSIDRIDTEGNYEPGNLRWATSAEQMNNLSLTPRRNSKCTKTHRFDLSFIPSQESKDPSAPS